MRLFETFRYVKPTPAGSAPLSRPDISEQAQREVVADRFPLLVLNGRHVRETVVKEATLRGMNVPDYVSAIDQEYDRRLSNRMPIDILNN
jgi:hypothetical protein